ncbi:MAG: cytochrome b N-terminal domain-containing protein, partial [Gemmatimonadota bacterium]
MASRVGAWIRERWPVDAVLRLSLDEEIPGGASYAYVFGSATLFAFAVQIVTGIWQLFYYVPTVDHAYDSVNYLRTEVPMGWLVHGLHYWGANAIIVLVGLHMARVFIWGAYKRPRELTWLTGIVLLLITAGLVFTGAPLPWDER